ncbi:nucleotide-binding alpha-beta plait domain-containing protein [Tanacetum coccineum]
MQRHLWVALLADGALPCRSKIKYSAKDLFNICKQYGHVVDAFIPLKKSKVGKRFGFVRFINVFSVERLIQTPIGKGTSFANIVTGPVNHGSNDKHIPTSLCLGRTNSVLSKSKIYLIVCFRRVKEFASLANIKLSLNNEGFMNLKISYMGEKWIMLEFVDSNAMNLFRENAGTDGVSVNDEAVNDVNNVSGYEANVSINAKLETGSESAYQLHFKKFNGPRSLSKTEIWNLLLIVGVSLMIAKEKMKLVGLFLARYIIRCDRERGSHKCWADRSGARIWNKLNMVNRNQVKDQLKSDLEAVENMIDSGNGNEEVVFNEWTSDQNHLQQINNLKVMDMTQKAKVKLGPTKAMRDSSHSFMVIKALYGDSECRCGYNSVHKRPVGRISLKGPFLGNIWSDGTPVINLAFHFVCIKSLQMTSRVPFKGSLHIDSFHSFAEVLRGGVEHPSI